MTTLQKRLRDLSAYKHSDCAIGAEAADELDRLAAENAENCKLVGEYAIANQRKREQLAQLENHDIPALRQERDRLREERDSQQRVCMAVMQERDALAATVEHLKHYMERSEYWRGTWDSAKFSALAQDFAAAPTPAIAATDDARDAARYRLLRRGQHWSVVDGLGDELRAEVLDAAIDAAMGDSNG